MAKRGAPLDFGRETAGVLMIFIDIFPQWFGSRANQKLQARGFSLLLGVEAIMSK